MRIIAGAYKGRVLKSPTWAGLRPTSDKLRETLFNVLADRVRGARVLDAFAGTGAIGIEALSRGASHVTFVERDRRAAALIASNLRGLSVTEGYAIIRDGIETAARRSLDAAPFDLIVLDPPYALAGIDAAMTALAPALAPGGWMVLEHAARVPPRAVRGLRHLRTIRSGDSALSLFAGDERGA